MVKFCDHNGHNTMSSVPQSPFHEFSESKIEMLLLFLFLNATIWTDMFDRIYYEC